jgi:hypothetical protein
MMQSFPPAARTFKDFLLTGAQTGTAIWTPANGFYIVLTELGITLSEPAIVTIFRGNTNEAGKRILYGRFPVGIDRVFVEPVVLGKDEVLRITTNTGTCYGCCSGYELIAR